MKDSDKHKKHQRSSVAQRSRPAAAAAFSLRLQHAPSKVHDLTRFTG
jgi:hypothetical protein